MESYSSSAIDTPEMQAMIADRRRHVASVKIAITLADFYADKYEEDNLEVDLEVIYKELIWHGFSRQASKEAAIKWHVNMAVYDDEKQGLQAFRTCCADKWKHPTKKQINAYLIKQHALGTLDGKGGQATLG